MLAMGDMLAMGEMRPREKGEVQWDGVDARPPRANVTYHANKGALVEHRLAAVCSVELLAIDGGL